MSTLGDDPGHQQHCRAPIIAISSSWSMQLKQGLKSWMQPGPGLNPATCDSVKSVSAAQQRPIFSSTQCSPLPPSPSSVKYAWRSARLTLSVLGSCLTPDAAAVAVALPPRCLHHSTHSAATGRPQTGDGQPPAWCWSSCRCVWLGTSPLLGVPALRLQSFGPLWWPNRAHTTRGWGGGQEHTQLGRSAVPWVTCSLGLVCKL